MSKKKRVEVRLSDEEFEKLNRDVSKSGLSREAYLRSLIRHEMPRGKPTEDYLEVIRQLRIIGNNINQIAVIAYKTNAIDIVRYKEDVKRLKLQIADIKRIASQPLSLEVN